MRIKPAIVKDKNILVHIELDKKTADYTARIEGLKYDSILKLNDAEKRRIYTQLRKEEEQKKKEELERLLDKNR